MLTSSQASRCRDCQQQIVFIQDSRSRKWVPYTAIPLGNGQYGALEPHNGKCPVKVRKRIEEHCVGCQLDAGRPILSVWHLVGFMRCEKHDSPEATFQHRGRTFGYDRESLRGLYRETHKEQRRLKKKSEWHEEGAADLTEYGAPSRLQP